MTARRTRTLMTAGLAVGTLAGALLVPAAAGAATAKAIPVVSVNLGKTVAMSTTHLRPGRVTFNVHSSKGDHTVQFASLRGSYTPAQANQDIGAGFGGNVAAIRRVDRNVSFKGGADASPKKPVNVTIYLSAGTYYAVNFDNGQSTKFTVSGAAVNRKTVHTDTTVTMLTYGFDSEQTLPRSGVMRLNNTSDQPHFLVLQQIKTGVSRAQLLAAFNSPKEPSFLLKGSLDSGVLTQTKTQTFDYHLPAGRYVMACFWPDDETGMQHAAMGMFKQVNLR